MRVLAIETSCDETGVAIVHRDEEGRVSIVAEALASQVSLHAAYGGVVPELAAREHTRALPMLVDRVIRAGGGTARHPAVDAVAVTVGPGLQGCLLVGGAFAAGLAASWRLPLLGVHHIEAHLAVSAASEPPAYPALGLIVSGGHTELHQIDQWGHYALIARTCDDAAGEAFDKSAALLGFPYPGGREVAAAAAEARRLQLPPWPDPLPHLRDLGERWSFSGLKTAVAQMIERQTALLHEVAMKQALCREIEERIVASITSKVRRVIEERGIRHLIVGGGVIANQYLINQLQAIPGAKCQVPLAAGLATDNGVMVGMAALLAPRRFDDMSPRPRWPLEELQV